jgi:transcriptional regulator with XRE-family HTH domain
MSFGDKLKELREGRDMSLRALSRKSGLALSHLQYLERDAKSPGDETLKRLAKALRVPVDELKTERITGQVDLLLKEAGRIGPISDEQKLALLDAVERAAGKAGRSR